MQTPEPDWFPSRVDLRRAWRWERARWALAGNLLFLAGALIFGWFGVPKVETFGAFLFLVSLVVASSSRFHSFTRIAEREQFEDLAARLSLKGCYVTCRYYEGDFELGSDVGYLGRDEGMLRFEGATSRFSLAAASLVHEPDLEVRNPELELASVRVQIKPDTDADVAAASIYLNRWRYEGGSIRSERMPPQSPQVRSWSWYFERATERHAIAMSFGVLAVMLLKLAIPESLQWARIAILSVPIIFFLLVATRTAVCLRREDEKQLTQRVETEAALPVSMAHQEETPLHVSAP